MIDELSDEEIVRIKREKDGPKHDADAGLRDFNAKADAAEADADRWGGQGAGEVASGLGALRRRDAATLRRWAARGLQADPARPRQADRQHRQLDQYAYVDLR